MFWAQVTSANNNNANIFLLFIQIYLRIFCIFFVNKNIDAHVKNHQDHTNYLNLDYSFFPT
jgi:hypothetical protein